MQKRLRSSDSIENLFTLGGSMLNPNALMAFKLSKLHSPFCKIKPASQAPHRKQHALGQSDMVYKTQMITSIVIGVLICSQVQKTWIQISIGTIIADYTNEKYDIYTRSLKWRKLKRSKKKEIIMVHIWQKGGEYTFINYVNRQNWWIETHKIQRIQEDRESMSIVHLAFPKLQSILFNSSIKVWMMLLVSPLRISFIAIICLWCTKLQKAPFAMGQRREVTIFNHRYDIKFRIDTDFKIVKKIIISHDNLHHTWFMIFITDNWLKAPISKFHA